MSLPNPNIPVIALTNGIDNLVPQAVVNFLLTKPIITNSFSQTILPFYRFDIASQALPGILVYPLYSNEEDQSYFHIGQLKIDIIFPTNVVKTNKLQSALNVSNWLILLFKSQGLDWIQTNFPMLFGLRFLGFKNKQDYRKLYDHNSVRSKLEIEFQYKVDIQAYWNWLINNGYDFTSPDIVIYNELNNILIDVEPQTAF
jgi:hypothetical protein